MSANSTNPGTLFGGSWTQITGRFLLAAGGGYSAGATGGEATHKLTVSEMPSHSHTIKAHFGTGGSNGGADVGTDGTTTSSLNTDSAGSGKAHNNMPPYLVVYVWRRTA